MIEGIPFAIVERQTAGAVRLGLPLDVLLSESMITRRHGDNRDVVSPTQYLLLCLNTLLGIDDASHGLGKVGLGPSYPAIGLRMILAYPTFGAALSALCRLYSTASNDMHLKVGCEGEMATLAIGIDAWSDREAAQIEEIQLGWLFMNCLHFLGRAPSVTRVTMRDPFHHNLGRPHWAMGGVVTQGSVTSMSFPRSLLAEPPAPVGGPVVFWECHKRWLDFVQRDAARPALSGYVNDAGFVRFSDLVRASGRSANTVRRRMQAEDGGFRASRRRTMVDAAMLRLRADDDSVDDVAADLGYSDARSLRRFLKAATGMTPQQVRLRVPADEQSADARALLRLRELSESLNI